MATAGIAQDGRAVFAVKVVELVPDVAVTDAEVEVKVTKVPIRSIVIVSADEVPPEPLKVNVVLKVASRL